MGFKERLKVSGGCGSVKTEGTLSLTINADGSWTADHPAGPLSGTLQRADRKGRKWTVAFDEASRASYDAYLEEFASSVCGTAVEISGEQIKKFEVKFKRDLTRIGLRLRTKAAGTSVSGTGKAKHAIKGKGGYTPAI